MVGTRVLQGVRAVDADQQGPYSTVQYSVLPGPHAVSFVAAVKAPFDRNIELNSCLLLHTKQITWLKKNWLVESRFINL